MSNFFERTEPETYTLANNPQVRIRTKPRDLGDQKWPDNLLIVRHGQSSRNLAKDEAKKNGYHVDFSEGVRDQDTALTPTGEMQAIALGVELRKRFCEPHLNGPTESRPIDIIYVSPYLRTRQTMDKAIEGLGYIPNKIVVEERIREIEFGLLDGLDRRGVEVKYPEEVRRKAREGKYWYRAPGGESRPDVKLRIRSFLGTLVRDCRGLNVLVVCHSVVVMGFRALLERWGEEEYLQVDKENDVKNASLTHYAYDTVETTPIGGLSEGWHEHKKLVLKNYNSIFYTEA